MSADEYKEFARQQQLRFERMVREFRQDSIRRHNENMRRFDENMLENRRRHDDHQAHLEEIRAENRTTHDALLRVLDRLDRLDGGGTAPAT
jgi:hypothetical protein